MRGERGQAAEYFSNNLLIVPRGKFYSFNFALTTLLLLVFLSSFLSFLFSIVACVRQLLSPVMKLGGGALRLYRAASEARVWR